MKSIEPIMINGRRDNLITTKLWSILHDKSKPVSPSKLHWENSPMEGKLASVSFSTTNLSRII